MRISNCPSAPSRPPRTALRTLCRGGLLVAVGLLLTGCGADTAPGDVQENQDDGEDEVVAPEVIDGIETRVDTSTITAGESLQVTCQYLDPLGEPVSAEQEIVDQEEILAYPDNAIESEEGELVPVRAGLIEVACQNQELGLTDFEPAEVTVEPAEAVITRAELADHQMVAGDQIGADCIAFDEYSNLITDADFELTPDTSEGVEIAEDELAATVTSAGVVAFSCHLDGAEQRYGDIVEVLPADPATLDLAPTPDQNVYNTGQIVTAGTMVEDRYGNRISDPPMNFEAGEGEEILGQGRFRFPVEGTHTVTAEVTGPTYDDRDLSESFDVVVNESGPDISCVSPANGEMITAEDGETIDFEGVVSDEYDIQEVVVGDETVSVDADGSFSTTVDTRYGINFVEITATDEFDTQNVHTCAFQASENWEPQYNDIDQAVSLVLSQSAVDDGEYDGSYYWNIKSFNDLVQSVLRSSGFENEIKNQMQSQTYDLDITYNGIGCTYDVSVQDFSLGYGHSSSLELTDGGLQLPAASCSNNKDFTSCNDDTVINQVEVDLYASHDTGSEYVCPDSYSTTAYVEWLTIDLLADLSYSDADGTNVALNSVDAQSGHVSADGWLGSAAEFFLQGTLQNAVEDQVETAVSDSFDELFDDLLDSIDSYTVGFDVPRLGGGEDIPMDFYVGLDNMDFGSDEAQFDLNAEISTSASADPYIPSNGVAYPPPADDFLDAPYISYGTDLGGSAHVALLNQALHQLWRAGMFHDEFGGDTLSGLDVDLPEGASVEIEAALPPMAVLHNYSDAELMFGALKLHVEYPGIFDDPVTFDVGAVATTDVEMSGGALTFDGIEIADDDFHFSTDEASLDQDTYDVLQNFFTSLIQDVLDQTVNSALPEIPIPSFTIPSSMSTYDLPDGRDMGLVDSAYDQTDTHMEITGDFGIQ